MIKKKFMLISLIPFIPLISCSSKPAKEYKDGFLLVHPYVYVDGKKLSEEIEIPVVEGEDISGKICITYHQDYFDDNVKYITGIYLDEKEEEVLENSKIYSYEKSVKEIYIKCELLTNINLEKYISGEFTNIAHDKLTIMNDSISGTLFETISFNNTYAKKSGYEIEVENVHVLNNQEDFVFEDSYSKNISISNGYFKEDGSYKKDINYQCISIQYLWEPIVNFFDKQGAKRERPYYYERFYNFSRYSPLSQ